MKIKSILIRVLCLMLIACFSLFAFTACDSVKLEIINKNLTYLVGDNVDVFDLFSYEEGQEYQFSYTFNDKTETIEGETFYLLDAGTYNVTATAIRGKSKKTLSTEINVTDELATMSIVNKELEVPYEGKVSLKMLLGRASISVAVESDYSLFIDSVTIDLGEDEKVSYQIIETYPTPGNDDSAVYKSTPDGFFNGKVFNFIYETEYKFVIGAITGGGISKETIKVVAVELFSDLTPLTGLEYDDETKIVSWQEVEGASLYRVKAGRYAKEINATQINVLDVLPKTEFHYFDLYVVPKSSSGEKLGVMSIKDIIISPEGSENVILSDGATADGKTRTATLMGGESFDTSAKNGLNKLNNSYMAYYGDYGIGTFVEFTFTGNNLPQVCFFADKINGNMTELGGSGYVIMNGMYTPNKGGSASTTQVVGENRLICLGPNRFTTTVYPYYNYYISSEQTKKYLMSENTLFTQKALENDSTGRTYKYVVGSLNCGGILAFEATLFDVNTNQVVAGPVTYFTDVDAIDAPKGHIIAYATVKGEGNNTVFSYSKPYVREGSNQSSFGVISSETDGDMTKVVLEGKYSSDGIGWQGIQSTLKNSYVGFEDKCEVGTYIDFTFKGNNMPQVMLFADKINCIMTCGAESKEGPAKYNGYLLMNGIYGKVNANGVEVVRLNHGDRLVCFGPNRMGINDKHYVVGWQAMAANTVSTNKYFTQNFFNEDTSNILYRYTVGTFVDASGMVIIEVYIKNATTGQVYAIETFNTSKTETEIESLGSHIVAYGASKGENVTNTFSYSEPYKIIKDDSVILSGAIYNENGSVTLGGKQLLGGVSWDAGVRALDNTYVAFKGNYGVGTYVEFIYSGNNMPQVMLFANNINGDMSCGNSSKDDFETNGSINNGYIIMSGAYTKTSYDKETNTNYYSIRHGDRVMCIGPYRNSPTLSLASYNSATSWPVSEATISDNIPEIEQEYLANDNSGDQYKYIVGSYLKDGVVYINIVVKNQTKGVNLGEKSWSTGKTQAEIESLGTNIVVYGTIKENYQENTTFYFTSPYKSMQDGVVSYGAKFYNDGSVSLDSRYSTNGWGYWGGVHGFENSYIAFEGNYGVGTYVDFTFTGNNLPQVCLFANNINGDMSQGEVSTKVNTGYLLMNGMYYTSDDVPDGEIKYPDYLVFFGPNRHASDWNYGALDWKLGITSDTNFQQETLKNNTNQLKYTVGTYLDADLTVIIEVLLYDLTNDRLLKTATKDTGKTQTEVEALGGNIIAYGCCKGGIEPTTFKYTTPYAKQNEVE